jgi:hypothetical protein
VEQNNMFSISKVALKDFSLQRKCMHCCTLAHTQHIVHFDTSSQGMVNMYSQIYIWE